MPQTWRQIYIGTFWSPHSSNHWKEQNSVGGPGKFGLPFFTLSIFFLLSSVSLAFSFVLSRFQRNEKQFLPYSQTTHWITKEVHKWLVAFAHITDIYGMCVYDRLFCTQQILLCILANVYWALEKSKQWEDTVEESIWLEVACMYMWHIFQENFQL